MEYRQKIKEKRIKAPNIRGEGRAEKRASQLNRYIYQPTRLTEGGECEKGIDNRRSRVRAIWAL
jgi:hypothetical protein